MINRINRLLFGERNGLVKKSYKLKGWCVTEFKDKDGVWVKLKTPAKLHRLKLDDI